MTLDRRNLPAVREGELAADAVIPHLDASAVRRLIDAARTAPQTGERNALLIAAMFEGCLPVSEALGLRPVDLVQSDVVGRPRWWASYTPAPTGGCGYPGAAASSRLAGAGSTRSFRKPPITPGLPSRSTLARSTST